MFGDVTSGAGDDIRRVTDMARKMVTELGMSEKLGPLAFGQREEMVFLGRDLGEQRNYSEEVAAEIDAEVQRIVNMAYERARKILIDRRQDLITLAEHLKEVETMEGDDMDKMLRGEPVGEVAAAAAAQEEPAATPGAPKRAPSEGEGGRKRPLRPEPSPS